MSVNHFGHAIRVARRIVAGLAVAVVLAFALAGNAAAQDVAAAGNGGTAVATANGGFVFVGDINSGGNTGNLIVVGDIGASCPAKC